MATGEKEMTLVIAAQGKDFVILGTDSRGTITDGAGNRMELNIQMKLIKVTELTGILLYGAANEANYIIEKFKNERKNSKIIDVTKVAEEFAAFCRNEARITSDVPALHFPSYGFIIAGLNKIGKDHIPCCYSIKSTSGFKLGLYKQGFGIEGKPFIAYYLFSKHYRLNQELDELLGLVAKSLYETMSIDGDVGGEIKLAIVNQDGIRDIIKRDINTYISKFDGLNSSDAEQ